jgi:Ca2+-binding EF-hand superfamily protein
MFDAVDSNNDGTITAEEFYSVMSVKIPDWIKNYWSNKKI